MKTKHDANLHFQRLSTVFNVRPIICIVKVLTVIQHWCEQPDHPPPDQHSKAVSPVTDLLPVSPKGGKLI